MISLKEKNLFFDFITLFIIVFFFNVLFLMVSYYIYNKSLFDSSDLQLLSVRKFISYVIVLPLIEELAFRGFFSFTNKLTVLLSLLCLLIIIVIYFKVNTWTIAFISIMIVLGGYLIIGKNSLSLFNGFIENYFILLLVISSFLFSIAHIRNYNEFNFQTILMIIPRFIGGLYFGYIAFKYGILKSFLLHLINNLLPFVYLSYKFLKA